MGPYPRLKSAAGRKPSIVREVRKRLRLTQRQFAELTGVSVDCIGKIERGVVAPSMQTLAKIALALKMSVGELIDARPAERENTVEAALDDLVGYLKGKRLEDIRFLHELAVKVFERRPRAGAS